MMKDIEKSLEGGPQTGKIDLLAEPQSQEFTLKKVKISDEGTGQTRIIYVVEKAEPRPKTDNLNGK